MSTIHSENLPTTSISFRFQALSMSTTTTNSTAATTGTAPQAYEVLPGFEIRQLGPEHLEITKAVMAHSMIFESPIWSKVIPQGDLTKHIYQLFNMTDTWAMHGLKSGYSYGVFDKNYVFKRPESAATNGKLHWDQNNLSATKEELLEQMDFPLASVALAYDGINVIDPAELVPMVQWLPGVPGIMKLLEERDTRDPASWKPTAPGQAMFRNATQTRSDYQGRGLMKALAHFLMRQAKEEGFRAIKIECFNEILPRVWCKPPAPFKGTLVSEAHSSEVEDVDENGQTIYPIRAASQKVSRIYVELL